MKPAWMLFRLAHCDTLFKRYFDRWSGDEDRARKGFSATRPDMLENPDWIGASAASLSPLAPESQASVLKQIDAMLDAVRSDWAEYLEVSEPLSLGWLTSFDRHYDAERIKALVRRSKPNDFENEYLVTCCELGAVIGNLLQQQQPRLEWIPDWPYWESSLLDSKTGTLVPPFHWAVKKMSRYGANDGLVDKCHACLAALTP